jgi:hypothetical protein
MGFRANLCSANPGSVGLTVVLRDRPASAGASLVEPSLSLCHEPLGAAHFLPTLADNNEMGAYDVLMTSNCECPIVADQASVQAS